MQSGLGKNFAAHSKEQTRSVDAAGRPQIVCVVSPALLLFGRQWLNVQMESSDEWHPSRVPVGTSTV